jgi:hypothetical protein
MKFLNRFKKHTSKDRPYRFKINPTNTFELIDYEALQKKNSFSAEDEQSKKDSGNDN